MQTSVCEFCNAKKIKLFTILEQNHVFLICMECIEAKTVESNEIYISNQYQKMFSVYTKD